MNIYVGNLAREASESDLRDAFQAYGEVSSAAIIKDKFSGDSRGFGFVEMPNKSEAEQAISSLNGKSIKGRNVTVNEAKPRTDSRGGSGSGGGFGSRRY
jgi:RNA recognition motif-containing protein